MSYSARLRSGFPAIFTECSHCSLPVPISVRPTTQHDYSTLLGLYDISVLIHNHINSHHFRIEQLLDIKPLADYIKSRYD